MRGPPAIVAMATISQKNCKNQPFVGCTRHISDAERCGRELFNNGAINQESPKERGRRRGRYATLPRCSSNASQRANFVSIKASISSSRLLSVRCCCAP
jgi:hypothetical protein